MRCHLPTAAAGTADPRGDRGEPRGDRVGGRLAGLLQRLQPPLVCRGRLGREGGRAAPQLVSHRHGSVSWSLQTVQNIPGKREKTPPISL